MAYTKNYSRNKDVAGGKYPKHNNHSPIGRSIVNTNISGLAAQQLELSVKIHT